MLPDHGSPRTAPGLGLRIDVCVQILLHHAGRCELGRTAGSSAGAARQAASTFERVGALHCGNSGASPLGTAGEAHLKW